MPVEIPGVGTVSLRTLGKDVYSEFFADDMLTYASAVAFHGVLALFPFILLLLAALTLLDAGTLIQSLHGWIETVLPQQSSAQIQEMVRHFFDNRRAGLFSLSMLGALWAASGGMRSAMNGLNQAYDVEEERSRTRRYLLSLAYTVAFGVLVVCAIALLLIGPRAIGWVADQLELDEMFVSFWRWTRYPLAALMLVGASAVAYSSLPNVPGFRIITPGSVVAVTLWIGAALLFRLYISHFGRYSVLYGSVGALIVLMIYVWISAIILLVGAEINAVLRSREAPAS